LVRFELSCRTNRSFTEATKLCRRRKVVRCGALLTLTSDEQKPSDASVENSYVVSEPQVTYLE